MSINYLRLLNDNLKIVKTVRLKFESLDTILSDISHRYLYVKSGLHWTETLSPKQTFVNIT